MENADLRLPEPDATFRLTDAERATIQPRFDADALERLLAMLLPSERAIHFASFQVQTGDSRRELAMFGDAVLNQALGEVWKPYVDSLPAWALADPALNNRAGIDGARARRSRILEEKQAD
ncbi:hypothetical protein BH09GEM1_BH09GEM1_23700 [soil metagenome]